MFGYVVVNKPEMKIREYAKYKGYYCGLCQTLYNEHGRIGQLTLTYDMTFLVVLLSSLYEPKEEHIQKRCLVHPAKKQLMITNDISKYAADMNIILAHDHLVDDWKDEEKTTALFAAKIFQNKRKELAKKYPRQAKAIKRALHELNKLEKEKCEDIDKVSKPFGDLMAELFVWKEDAFSPTLRNLGFYLGKYIYIVDAYDDVVNDLKKGCYNPFAKKFFDKGFNDEVKAILKQTMKLAIAEFEKLPCEQDLSILRNILYEGVFTKSKMLKGELGNNE